MIQEIIIGILFLGAVFFIGRHLWRQYKADKGCAVGCQSCDVSDGARKSATLPEIKADAK